MIPGLGQGGYKMNPEPLSSEIREVLKKKCQDVLRQFEGAPTGYIWNYLRTKNQNQRTIMNYRPLEKRRIHQFTRNINM